MKTTTLLKLGETSVTVADLVEEFNRLQKPAGLHLPELGIVLMPIPEEDYALVLSIIEARKRRTPFELFAETVRRLRELERKYGMSSAEFYAGFQSGAIQEGPLDYFDWRVEYGSFLSMKERFGFSEEEVSDA